MYKVIRPIINICTQPTLMNAAASLDKLCPEKEYNIN
jgi:hypothetical protein